MAAPRMLPLTAGALLVNGTVHTHTSVRGDLAPNLHPVIRRFLDELPSGQRERFAGWCAEVVLLSDRLYEAEADGGSISPTQARSLLWGANVWVTRIREEGDPRDEEQQPPCRSCAALLDWLGVEGLA
ncbi:hypothetical protein Strop_0468 [Salinispora tropica CNB-440]|uniref:YwqJ-like deaminase n=2 Tax=Salinispora tropica TaxID=168695 RepID=A4X253_SALTO|nr:hypothetical protein Strop_0468 [Salinispora tropica CNB-440]